MNKDGHTDVASSKRMMQTIIEDAKPLVKISEWLNKK